MIRTKLLGLLASAAVAAGLSLAPAPAFAGCTAGAADAAGHVTCTTPGQVTPGTYDGPYEPWDGRSSETRLVPACMQNAGPDDPNADAMCMGATMCPTRGEIRFRVYARPTLYGKPTGDWELQTTECVGPDEATAMTTPPVTVPMVVDAAKKLAPQPTAHIEPGTWSLVNVPNNYYTESEPVTRTVTVLGQNIAITFTPRENTWSFGDGATAVGDGVQGAGVGQAGAVEHSYTRTGSYDVTVSRGFDLTFALPGGAVTIGNAFAVDSPVATLPVREMQTRVDAVH